MATNKEFSFDDDGDDFSLEPENFPKPKRPAGGGGGSKRLLWLLLLVAAGAGAYFYLYGGFPLNLGGPPAQKVAVPVKAPAAQPVAVKPVQPAPAAQPVAAKPVQPAPAAQPVAVKPPAAVPEVPPPAVKPTEPAAPSVAVKPTASQPAAQPVAVKPTQPAPVVQPVAVKPAPPAPVVPLEQGRFQLSAGAFLVKANLLATEKHLRKLGFEPQRSTVKRPVAMIRLRIGRFAPQEAAARLAELRVKYPEAFTIQQGNRVALYAGSYRSINLARSYADRLFLNDGIHVDEEPVTLSLKMTVVHFGAFADRAEAQAAAKRVQAAGLDDITVSETR